MNYYFLNELEDRIWHFVDYYNHARYHDSLDNLVPADVFYDRKQSILDKREKIKRRTLTLRRQMFYANKSITINLKPSLNSTTL